MRTIVLWFALLACYIVLSGQIHNSTLMTGGVLGATAVVLITAWMGILDDETVPWQRWPATARYLPWIVWQILLANWDVLKRVMSRTPELSPTMVQLSHRLPSAYGQATYANSITLTPGTVTIAMDDHTLLVHSISAAGAADLQGGGMHDKVMSVFESTQTGSRRAS